MLGVRHPWPVFPFSARCDHVLAVDPPVERSSHDVDVDPAVIRPMFYTSMMPSRSTRSLSSDASSPRAAPALTPPGGATASSPPDQFRVAATRGSAGVLTGHHE